MAGQQLEEFRVVARLVRRQRASLQHARYSSRTALCSASYIAVNATLLAFAAECRAARDKVQRRASNSEESDLAGVRAQLNCRSLDCKR